MDRFLHFLNWFLTPLFQRMCLFVLCTLYSVLSTAQNFPVQVIPQALPPAPIYVSNYADASTVTSPLRVQIILNDFEISNREIRLKTYFTGSGLSFQSNDIVVGASPLFLEGGIPLVLNNVELAPYFEFNNITGINANQYGAAIPEGAYQFCVEVYDVLTGNRLSDRSCAVNVVFQNEPPFLVLPQNKVNVDEVNPQYTVFQWTPRSINVSNVEYELSLVEIWDNQVDPQQAFLSSPPVFQTTTSATTYVYGPSHPLLLSGKKYAWRVQAKAKQGTEEIGLFKNEGYSEIYSFSYATSCDLPTAVNHEVKGSTNANIFWDDFSTDIPEYTVRYRKPSSSDDNEWFESKTTTNLLTLWDLKARTTYEYQVNKKCTVTESDWSLSKQFTTFIADDEASVYECGIAPDFNLTNQEPLPTIGDKFTAGDFPIKVIEASGSNGRFTGKGYVTIPYLNSIKVGVEFTNVLINTDNQLVEGSVITIYDPSLSNILDIDDAIDTVTDAVDAVGDFIDALADWLSGYTGTEEEQKELEERTDQLNKELEEAISDPNLDSEKKEALEKSKDELNKAKDELLQEGTNPTSESKEAYKNSSEEVMAELNSLESTSEVTTDNTSVASDDTFDGIINFSTPESQIISELTDGRNYSEDIIGIGTLTGQETSAYRVFEIKANKTLYVSNNKVSLSDFNVIQENLESVGNNEYRFWIHYDFDAKQVKYKIAFGINYFKGVSIEKDKLANLYNDVLTFNLKGYIGSAILNVTEKFDGLLEQYKDNIPFLDKEIIAGLTAYDILKVAINFSRNCANDFQGQQNGIVPKCLWNQDLNPSIAYYAGFIDAAWEIGELVVDLYKLKDAWDPLSPFFSTSEAFEIRQQTMDAFVMLQNLYDNKNGERSKAWESIKSEVSKYVDETVALDAQARYNQGKLIFEVASAFFGIAEIKAFAKTGKITSELLTGLSKISNNLTKVFKALPGKLKKLQNNTLAYIISVNTFIEIARYTDDGVLIAIKWIDNPDEIVENLGELSYKKGGSDSAILTDELAIAKDSNGDYGLTTALSLIRQLVSRPVYIANRIIWSKQNKTTTLIGKWKDELEKVFEELGSSDLNIYLLSGKFDNPGGFNMLSIENWTSLKNEIEAVGIKLGTKAFDDYIWDNYNRPWLESAMQRGDEIVLWSDPKSNKNLEKFFDGDDTFGETFYSRELKFLNENAIKYNYDFQKGIDTGLLSQ